MPSTQDRPSFAVHTYLPSSMVAKAHIPQICVRAVLYANFAISRLPPCRITSPLVGGVFCSKYWQFAPSLYFIHFAPQARQNASSLLRCLHSPQVLLFIFFLLNRTTVYRLRNFLAQYDTFVVEWIYIFAPLAGFICHRRPSNWYLRIALM